MRRIVEPQHRPQLLQPGETATRHDVERQPSVLPAFVLVAADPELAALDDAEQYVAGPELISTTGPLRLTGLENYR